MAEDLHPLLSVKDKDGLASLLGTTKKKLNYLAYVLNETSKYDVFQIKKRNGELREIQAPKKAMKVIQRRIAVMLKGVYEPKVCAHGYIEGRNIVTNASIHLKQNWLFTIDLHNFFPSINFGRVRGLFLKHPFNLPAEVSTILAQLCTLNGCLPQGGPSSPIISNLICQKLDRQLSHLAIKNRCYYSRYADDIVFSTKAKVFPSSLGYIKTSEDGILVHCAADHLSSIICENGFEINNKKTSLRGTGNRQIVTGIVVNHKINVKREYVRELRSILHSWRVHGRENAANYFLALKNKKNRTKANEEADFAAIVKGKVQYLGHVKGWNDPTYLGLAKKLSKLDKSFKNKKVKIHGSPNANVHVWTEGPTDIKHLQAALTFFKQEWQFTDLEISYADFGYFSHGGDDALITKCTSLASHCQSKPTIVISDRDSPAALTKLAGEGGFKDWGNNVYSFVLPVPEHREGTEKLCIEMLYKDDAVKQVDPDGRRIFFSSEFNAKTNKHLSENCYCPKLSTKKLIIDTEVFDYSKDDDKSLCLSKNKFANYILQKTSPFDNVDFSGFEPVFVLIDKIIQLSD